jgi:WD40 repeat protein
VYRIYIKNQASSRTKKIFKGGYRIAEKPDYTYPLITWHPSGKLLAMIVERKGEIYLYFYNVNDKHFEKQVLYDFQKVLDFSYSDDGNLLLFSAIQKGQSDIFVYNIASGSYQQITKDIFNDLNPRFINNSRDIIFSSNRNNDTIRFDEKVDITKLRFPNDIFIYNYSSRKNILHRITNTPLADEIQPMPYSDNYFCYLGDQNGIYNRYLARFDSTISYIDTTTHYRFYTLSYPVTNYSRNIIEQETSLKAGKLTEIMFVNQQFSMFQSEMLPPKYVPPVKLQSTSYSELLNKFSVNPVPEIKTDSSAEPEKPGKEVRNKHFSTVRITTIIAPSARKDTLISNETG